MFLFHCHITNQQNIFEFLTWSRGQSSGLKTFGEQPHQSTICLYWHLHPCFLFQLVTWRLLSIIVSQYSLFWRTVWKKDYQKERKEWKFLKANFTFFTSQNFDYFFKLCNWKILMQHFKNAFLKTKKLW